ncbi:hypothetical protein [Promicromonospora umidemergens]|uniref:Uncharacterized protein n=1 Tax=Promicromonospora umidemergens TaxID=629679 RepID=A0ABP8XLT7_9MICO|nr:hypothetical protein [Promicromonospora umidemergens]
MLYIYDGANDGDTIYVRVQWWAAGYPDDTTYCGSSMPPTPATS